MAKRNLPYTVLPTVGQWKSDSANAAAPREDDHDLLRIDQQLSELQHLPPGASMLGPTLIDLFFDLNHWLERRCGEAAHRGRWDAVSALRDAVRDKLRPMIVDARDPESFNAALARVIRTMKALGVLLPFSQEKVLNHRLTFRGGLAFQAPWWRERPGGELTLACSERIAGERGERREFLAPTEKAAPFIVLANQQIFLTRRHRVPADSDTCAQADPAYQIVLGGMLLVADGRLEALRLDSGDFSESDDLRGFLTYLKHRGVDLRALQLIDCRRGRIDAAADRFLRSGLTWPQFAGQLTCGRDHERLSALDFATSSRAQQSGLAARDAAYGFRAASSLRSSQ